MRDARAREDRHAKEETERKLNEELAQIAKLDPGIKSLDDLAKTEHFDEIVAKVQRGYSLTDAYTLANIGKLNAAGRQKALNAAGKDHLRALGGDTGGAPVTVPKAVLDSYHMMLPHMSDEDIAKDYAKRMKGR